jgi:hypothetical protein
MTDEKKPQIISRVEHLNEEVKSLALNMAIYLAKIKKDSEKISNMEPEFIRLVNSTVKVVQELTVIIDAAKNPNNGSSVGSSTYKMTEHLESKLNSIVSQCQEIVETLEHKKVTDS